MRLAVKSLSLNGRMPEIKQCVSCGVFSDYQKEGNGKGKAIFL